MLLWGSPVGFSTGRHYTCGGFSDGRLGPCICQDGLCLGSACGEGVMVSSPTDCLWYECLGAWV